MRPRPTASIPRAWRRVRSPETLALAGILLLGLALRGLYLRELSSAPDFSCPTAIDSDYHDDWARGLLTGNWNRGRWNERLDIPDVAYFRPPGYAHFLAMVYAVCGQSYLAARIAQMGVGLASCVLAWWFGRRWFGSAVGLIFAGFMSAYWVLIYYEGELHAPCLLVFLGLVLLSVLARWVERTSLIRCGLAGAVLGLFALVRPNILLFVPCVLGWCWWIVRGRQNPVRFARAASALLIGIAVVIAPVTIRNYVVSRDWVLISSNAGLALRVGNHESASGVGDGFMPGLSEFTGIDGWSTYDYPRIVRGLAKKLNRPLTPSEASRHLAGEALGYIWNHPLDWARLTAKKAAIFWGPVEIDSNKELHYARQDSGVLRSLPGGFALALSLAVVGTALLVRDVRPARRPRADRNTRDVKRWQVTVLVLLYAAAYSVSFLPFAITTRYRLPIVPSLLVLGAYGVYRVVQFAAARDARRTAVWAAVGIGVFALSVTSLAVAEPDQAGWHYYLANVYGRGGLTDRAMDEYRRVIRIRPNHALAHNRLGNALLAEGKTDEAIWYLTAAIQLSPRYADAHDSLGTALTRQGKIPQAIRHFNEAIRLQPAFARAHSDLGSALARAGWIDQAIKRFTEALRLDPGLPGAHVNLAKALAQQGQADQAIVHFKEALRVKPDLVEAHNNLGILLARRGKVDDAIEHFTEAVRLDPNRPDGHNNLGQALLDRGRPAEAAEQFAATVRLAPGHAKAHTTLAWILATRQRQLDAARAIRHATHACRLTGYRQPETLDALAAAQAAARQFDRAVTTAQKAADLATSAGRNDLAKTIRNRIRLYKARRSYRE